MLKLKVIPLKKIYKNPKLFNKLKNLTLSPTSNFTIHLTEQFPGRAIIAEVNNYIVGWAILYRESDHYMFGVYVLPEYRKKKVATLLAMKAKEISKKYDKVLYAEDWDRRSKLFFKSNNIPKKFWNIYL